MIAYLLKKLYEVGDFFMTPINYVWEYLFSIQLPCDLQRIVVIDIVGGSGKTTLCLQLEHCGYTHVVNDDCKYGENWSRYSEDEYEKILFEKLETSDKWAFDGTYMDPNLPRQQECVDELMDRADFIIYYDYPKIITLWRKLFRSFKRAIGVVPQGTAPEKLHNVIAMAKKTWNQYDKRREVIRESTNGAINRIQWPYYYKADLS